MEGTAPTRILSPENNSPHCARNAVEGRRVAVAEDTREDGDGEEAYGDVACVFGVVSG